MDVARRRSEGFRRSHRKLVYLGRPESDVVEKEIRFASGAGNVSPGWDPF
jgi:hypothetical protein